jgi:hypothetical protein
VNEFQFPHNDVAEWKRFLMRYAKRILFVARQSRFWLFHNFDFSMYWYLKQIFNLILCVFEFRFPRNGEAGWKEG